MFALLAARLPRGAMGFKYHQYVILGRHLPTEAQPEPPVYRMKLCAPDGFARSCDRARPPRRCVLAALLRVPTKGAALTRRRDRWSTDPVRARSKFWYFLRKLKKVKKSNGQIVAVNEISRRSPRCGPVCSTAGR